MFFERLYNWQIVHFCEESNCQNLNPSSKITNLQDQFTKRHNQNCKKPTDSLPLTII